MIFDLLRDIRQRTGWTVYEKAIAYTLASHADKAGRCYVGLGTLAREVGCSRGSVKKAISGLRSCGWLTWTSGRTGRANDYRIRGGHTVTRSHGDLVDHDEAGGGHTVTPLGHGVTTPRSHGDPQLTPITDQDTDTDTETGTPPLPPHRFAIMVVNMARTYGRGFRGGTLCDWSDGVYVWSRERGTVHGEGRTAEEAIAGISRAIHDSGREPLMFR